MLLTEPSSRPLYYTLSAHYRIKVKMQIIQFAVKIHFKPINPYPMKSWIMGNTCGEGGETHK